MTRIEVPRPAPDVRTRILQAALGLLAEHGVGALTQPKVARAAGVRQGHLTYYFPTRADLLLGVAACSIDALMGGMAQATRDGALTAATLPAALAAAASDRQRARILLGLAVTTDEDALLQERFREFVPGVRARIAAQLAQLGLRVDADTLAACHSMLVGAAVLHFARDSHASREELRRVMAVLVEQLLLRGGAPGRKPRPGRRRGDAR